MITRDSKAAIPVLDPTQGKQPYKKTHIGFELPQKCNTLFLPNRTEIDYGC